MMTTNYEITALSEAIRNADAIVVGAGSGLSSAAGYDYGFGVLDRYFPDFVRKYNFNNLYEASFCPFESDGEYFAFWSRTDFINRYTKAKKPVYDNLKKLLDGKDFFVITTNVDHCFQRAGFDKARLFYTQGDYGLWQCCVPCHRETYDNEKDVLKCLEAQGFSIDSNGKLKTPEFGKLKMEVPDELVPRCPKCGRPFGFNLRVDDTFVQDSGWDAASERYDEFLDAHRTGKVLYLDLGCGMNTPAIFKYPFMNMTYGNPKATYATVNLGEAYTAKEISDRSICVDGDLNEIIAKLLELKNDAG